MSDLLHPAYRHTEPYTTLRFQISPEAYARKLEHAREQIVHSRYSEETRLCLPFAHVELGRFLVVASCVNLETSELTGVARVYGHGALIWRRALPDLTLGMGEGIIPHVLAHLDESTPDSVFLDVFVPPVRG